MNLTEKKERHPPQRSRAQLRQDLAEVRHARHDQEKLLVACQQQLETARAQGAAAANAPPALKAEEQEPLRAEARALREQRAFLLAENEALQKSHLKVKEESATLRQQLREAEEKSHKHRETANRERREVERLTGHLKELEKKIAGAKPPSEVLAANGEAFQDSLAGSRAAFRIFVYPAQEYCRGKIEHILTGESRAFSGLDAGTIVDFIASHLPEAPPKTEEPMHLPVSPGPLGGTRAAVFTGMPTPQVLPKAENGSSRAPGVVHASASPERFRVREMQAAPVDKAEAGNLIWHGHPFEVRLTFDCAAGAIPPPTPVRCHIAIHAKNFESEVYQTLGEMHHDFVTSPPMEIGVPSAALARGLYRLDAIISFAGFQHPQIYSSKLLHVC